MKIGIIGAGQIGATLIGQYTKAGLEVKMSNRSGVEKLKALESETGAKAVTLREVIDDIDILVISIPLNQIPGLAQKIGKSLSFNTLVIDTTNYYPIRDGRIGEIENGMPESVWVSKHLSRPVIKVYNSILAGSLVSAGDQKVSVSRIALPISGDSKDEKEIVVKLLNSTGFDGVDIGSLNDSWRQQPGSSLYCTDLTLSQLKQNVQKVRRELLPERRELALQFILQQNPSLWLNWWKDCVANNRIVYATELKD